MKKRYIFTPGPVKMSKKILKIGSQQTPYFRNAKFSKVLLECEEDILKIANAPKNSRVIFLTSSGTAMMEAVVLNLFDKNNKILVANGGGFGERFLKICKNFKTPHQEMKIKNSNLKNISSLKIDEDIDSFLVNAHETSIGVLYDLNSIGKFCKKNNLLNVVDAISMFVTDELDMKKQNIDVMIASSHKGLAIPPGISFAIFTPKAIKRFKNINSLYFNFKDYLKDGLRGQTPYTPAVTIVLQLHKRLKQIRKNGLKNEIKKTKRIAKYFRKAIKPLPLKFYSQFMPNAMTTIKAKNAFKVVEKLEQNYGVVVCPNGGEFRDKIFRVSHMGDMSLKYTDILIDALFDYYKVKR